jgi:hypothetical protein
VFNYAAALVLAAMEQAVVAALHVPGVSWAAEFRWPWLASASGVGLLLLLALGYARGWRGRAGGYWLPFACLGLVLVLGVRGVAVPTP